MLKYNSLIPKIPKERLRQAFSPYKNIIGEVNLGSYKNILSNKLGSYKDFLANYWAGSEKPEKKREKISEEELKLYDKYKKITGEIKINSLSKKFGNHEILNNINLSIPKGKIIGLVGVSGSGKTTLLKLIVGFYKPSKGNIVFNGKDTLKYNREIRRSFGFGAQENCFYDKLNVDENIRYFGKLYGLTDDYINYKVDDILDLVDLKESRKVLANELSTGMRRRLDIACSLIHDPSVLILDEPTEDLDPKLRKGMLHLIRKINKEGKTVIMTSHLLGEIEQICDVVGIISEGKLIKIGSPEELKRQYSKDFEIHLETQSKNYKALLRGLKYSKMTSNGKRAVLYVSNGEKIVKEIVVRVKRKKDKIVNLRLSRPSLSEAFEAFTKNIKHK